VWEGNALLSGKVALARYWRRQFVTSQLACSNILQYLDDKISMPFEVPTRAVQAKLKYSEAGLILRNQCRPAALA
jgi:hypothetical protein